MASGATRAKQIKLTKSQRSAVEIYVTDPAHESISFMLLGFGCSSMMTSHAMS